MKRLFQYFFWLIARAVMVPAISANLLSAETTAPIQEVDGSFIREWLVLGPFPTKDMEKDLLAGAGGETNARPKEGDTITSPEGQRLMWKRFQSPHDMVHLERFIEPTSAARGPEGSDWGVFYAYCELRSVAQVKSYIRASAQNTTLVRLNGTPIGEATEAPFRSIDLAPVLPCQFEPGQNRCLLKLKFIRSDCRFMFQPLPSTHSVAVIQAADLANQNAAGALVEFYSGQQLVARTRTDKSGKALACLFPITRVDEVRVTSRENGVWLTNVALRPGESRQLKAELPAAVSISGQVLAMDDSPQNAIVVQALYEHGTEAAPLESIGPGVSEEKIQSLLPKPAFSQTTLTDQRGSFRFVNLRPGRYRLRCHGADGLVLPNAGDPNRTDSFTVTVEPGRTQEGIKFVFPEAKNGVWKSYSITRGLKEVHPMVIHRTRDGLLWIGTDDSSLQVFDGVEFKMGVSAPDILANDIRALEESPDGSFWIGTSDGINRHTAEGTQPFPPGAGLTGKRMNDIATDGQGAVLFGSEAGFGRYDGKNFTRFTLEDGLPGNLIISVVSATNGAVWLGTQFGLARFDGRNFSCLEPFQGHSRRDIGRLHQARDGAIWFATAHGAYRYDGHGFFRLGIEDGLPSDLISDIAETSDGAIWIATRQGLSKYNGVCIVNFTMVEGLSNEWVRDILVDPDGALWCANGWGISRFDRQSFIPWTRRSGLRASDGGTPAILTIETEAGGGAWIGTAWGGVFQLREGKLEPLPAVGDRTYVRRIHRSPDGTLWFGGSAGLAKFENGQFVPKLARDWVIALSSDQDGNLWYGHGWNGHGLSRYNPKTQEDTLFTTAQGLPNDNVWALERSVDGGIWIGTGKGLARFRNGKIEDFRAQLGVAEAVYDLQEEPDGAVWIGTGQGLHRLKKGKQLSLTATNGLPDPHIWGSVRTRDGIIWMATDNHGLAGYDGRAITLVDQRDGLLGNQVLAVAVDADDSLLLGFGEGGITRYRPAKTPPSVRLVSMQIDENVAPSFSKLPKIVTGNRLSLEYQGIDLKTHPEKRQFWYELTRATGEPLQSAVTKNSRFEWTPRQGGLYQFEVRAIDRDLNYSAPARVLLQVTVPWHSNPWILTPVGVIFGGLLVWAFIARALYLRKSREAVLLSERVRIARDLHDHLGAGLTDLALAGDLVRQHLDGSGAPQVLATRLSESARELTRMLGEVIWMIDPAKDSLQSFASYLNTYAERFFAGSSLRLRFDFPNELPALMLPAEMRRSLLMVAREALQNTAKHAEASELRIRLEVRDRQLHLIFEDDGRGFLTSEADPEQRGLANMRQRLRELGGHLEIESVRGQGTRVYARLPLPRK